MKCMTASWHGDPFRIIGPLYGESSRGPITDTFPPQRVSNANLWCFFININKLLNKLSSYGDLRHHDAHVTSLWWVYKGPIMAMNVKWKSGFFYHDLWTMYSERSLVWGPLHEVNFMTDQMRASWDIYRKSCCCCFCLFVLFLFFYCCFQ